MIHFDINKLKETYKSLEKKTCIENFWQNSEDANSIFQKMKKLKEKIDSYDSLKEKIKDTIEFLEILSQQEFIDYEKDCMKNIKILEKEYSTLKLKSLMVGEFDFNNAILEIHSGAGGTDAQDWTEMLERLYTRWINNKGFKLTILDYNSDTEGGIKSVTMKVEGENAYEIGRAHV